jgi:hypothetical protein
MPRADPVDWYGANRVRFEHFPLFDAGAHESGRDAR